MKDHHVRVVISPLDQRISENTVRYLIKISLSNIVFVSFQALNEWKGDFWNIT